MIRGLYTAVSGMITQEARQDVITNNMANVNTVGYKGDNLSVRKFNDVLIQNYDKKVSGRNVRSIIGSLSQGAEIDVVKTVYTQGLIQSTDKPTDFALDGSGFFTVSRNMLGTEKQYYSRDGHFHVNSAGYLVNDSGDAVLAKELDNNLNAVGEPKPIYVGTNSITSDNLGNISIGDKKYKFHTVNFTNYGDLKKVGDNLYDGANPIEENNVGVKQNSLEKSNVNVINEMVNMMTVSRTFESNQKVVQAMDETLNKAVNEVGTVR